MNRKWRASAAKSEAHEPFGQELIGSIGKGFLAFSVAAAASYSLCFDSPAMAESLTVAFPVSRTTEVIDRLSFSLSECCCVICFLVIMLCMYVCVSCN